MLLVGLSRKAFVHIEKGFQLIASILGSGNHENDRDINLPVSNLMMEQFVSGIDDNFLNQP